MGEGKRGLGANQGSTLLYSLPFRPAMFRKGLLYCNPNATDSTVNCKDSGGRGSSVTGGGSGLKEEEEGEYYPLN